jgi:hypothetical protein
MRIEGVSGWRLAVRKKAGAVTNRQPLIADRFGF